MIGSNTIIVKENNSYSVYIFGLFLPGLVKNLHEVLKESVKKYQPDASNLTDEEMREIFNSTHCCDKSKPFYSKFAGDCMFLVDVDQNKLFERSFENREFGAPLRNPAWKEYTIPKYESQKI